LNEEQSDQNHEKTNSQTKKYKTIRNQITAKKINKTSHLKNNKERKTNKRNKEKQRAN